MVVTGYAYATSCVVAKVRLVRKSVSVPITLCFVQYVYIGGCIVLEGKWVESRVDLITTYEWRYTWCRRHCYPTSGEFDLVGTNWTICGSSDKWRGVVGSWAMPGCCCYFVMLMRFVNCCGDVKLFADLSLTLILVLCLISIFMRYALSVRLYGMLLFDCCLTIGLLVQPMTWFGLLILKLWWQFVVIVCWWMLLNGDARVSWFDVLLLMTFVSRWCDVMLPVYPGIELLSLIPVDYQFVTRHRSLGWWKSSNDAVVCFFSSRIVRCILWSFWLLAACLAFELGGLLLVGCLRGCLL